MQLGRKIIGKIHWFIYKVTNFSFTLYLPIGDKQRKRHVAFGKYLKKPGFIMILRKHTFMYYDIYYF